MSTEKIMVKFDFTDTKEFANIVANLKKIEQVMATMEEKIRTLSSTVAESLNKGIQIMDAFFMRFQKIVAVESIQVINHATDAIIALTETIKNRQCCLGEGKEDGDLSTNKDATETSWWDDLKNAAQTFVAIVDFIDSIRKVFSYFKKIKDLFGETSNGVKKLTSWVDKGLSNGISRAINLALRLSILLSEGLPGIFLRLSAVIVTVGRVLAGLFATNPIGMLIFMIAMLVGAVIANFDTIKMYIVKVFAFLSDVFEKVWTSLKEGLTQTINFWFQIFEKVNTYLIGVGNAIAGMFGNVWALLKIGVETLFSFLSNVFEKVWEPLKEGLIQAIDLWFQKFEEIKTYLVGVCDAIAGIFSNVWVSLKEGFFETIDAITDGIKNFSFKDIFGWFGGKSDAINQATVVSNAAVASSPGQTKSVQTNNQLSVNQHIVTNDPKAAADLARRGFEREIMNATDNQGGALAY